MALSRAPQVRIFINASKLTLCFCLDNTDSDKENGPSEFDLNLGSKIVHMSQDQNSAQNPSVEKKRVAKLQSL